jgi:ribosome-binding protein aMBF1 (putative translation factor)
VFVEKILPIYFRSRWAVDWGRGKRETTLVPTIAQCFTENLARELARSPLSQEEVAARAGIHRTQISKLLKGVQIPRVDTLVKLEDALGVKRATLIQGITWNPVTSPSGEFKIARPKAKKG